MTTECFVVFFSLHLFLNINFLHYYVLLISSESWPPSAPDLQCLHRNYRAMVPWICGVKPHDEVPMDTLNAKPGIQEIVAVRTKSLSWYWQVSPATSCSNSIKSMEFPNSRGRGRPKKTWSECLRADIRVWSLGGNDPQNREALRFGVGNSSHLLPTPMPEIPAAVK